MTKLIQNLKTYMHEHKGMSTKDKQLFQTILETFETAKEITPSDPFLVTIIPSGHDFELSASINHAAFHTCKRFESRQKAQDFAVKHQFGIATARTANVAKPCNHMHKNKTSAIEYDSTYEMRNSDMHCELCGKEGTREELEKDRTI